MEGEGEGGDTSNHTHCQNFEQTEKKKKSNDVQQQ